MTSVPTVMEWGWDEPVRGMGVISVHVQPSNRGNTERTL